MPALQVLAAMVRSGDSLLALKSAMRKLPQTLINVTVPEGFVLEDCEAAEAERQRVEDILGIQGALGLETFWHGSHSSE